MKQSPVRVVVTGAGGQIGYSLLVRIASGEVFGDRPVDLRLLELPQAIQQAEGTAMELSDCAFPALATVNCYDNADQAFDGVEWALLVGARPRGPGMERGDLIRANGSIFAQQGKALNRAAKNVSVVVVGNPCNTNALIAQHNCPEIPPTQFFAMTMLDENRARAQVAAKAGVPVAAVKNMVVWGNHSSTMFPDFENATVDGRPALEVISARTWYEKEFMSSVRGRGAEIIKVRGKSSAASAASACIDHVKKLLEKTPEGEYFSAELQAMDQRMEFLRGLLCPCPFDPTAMAVMKS